MSSSNSTPVQASASARLITSNSQVHQVHIVRVTPVKQITDTSSASAQIKRFNNGDNKAVRDNTITQLQLTSLPLPAGTHIQTFALTSPTKQTLTPKVVHSRPFLHANILSSSAPVNITKKTFYGSRYVEKPVQSCTKVLPSPSSNITIQTVGIQKPVIRRVARVKAEPVCLTISSDDEETDDSANQSQSSCSQEQLTPSQEALAQQDYTATEMLNGNPLRPMDQETSVYLHCRSIRVGSYKIHNTAEPSTLPVNISKEGIAFTIPTVQDASSQVQLNIRIEDITSILVCFDRRLKIIIIYTTPGLAGVIRTRLKMTQTDSCYFDSASEDETQKRITILPDELTDNQKNYIRLVFGNTQKMTEISQPRANELLVRSTPVHDKSLVVTITPVITRSITIQHPTDGTSVTLQAINQEAIPQPPVVKLLTYPPPPQTGGITITSEDINCLNEGEYLNDVIIDFYLKYLCTEKLSEIDRNRTHIFSSYFFQRLSQKIVRTRNPDSLTNQEARHARVKTWTRQIDIFEKDFLIVPVNQQSHWFLVIICFPGLVSEESRLRNMMKANTSTNPDESTSQDSNKGEESVDNREPDMTEENSLDNEFEPRSECESSPSTNNVSTMNVFKLESVLASSNLLKQETVAVSTPNLAKPEGNIPASTRLLKLEPCSPVTSNFKDTPQSYQCIQTPDSKKTENLPQESNTRISETQSDVASSPNQIAKEPCIIIFDSLPQTSRWRIVAYLREYLQVEYKLRKGKDILFDRFSMKGFSVKVPKQSNYHDCGIYILHYVESFFERPLLSFKSPIQNLENWFTEEEINRKRPELKELIFSLQKKHLLTKSPRGKT